MIFLCIDDVCLPFFHHSTSLYPLFSLISFPGTPSPSAIFHHPDLVSMYEERGADLVFHVWLILPSVMASVLPAFLHMM